MAHETRLYARRWLVAGVVVFIGFQMGFASVFLGVLNRTLGNYFDIEASVVDWFTVGFSAGAMVGALPIGIYAALRPMKLKPWFFAALLIPSVTYVIMVFSMMFRMYPGLIIFAQFVNGLIATTFVPVVGLASTMWFSEGEQATVYGLGWSAFGFGSLFASVLSAIILQVMKNNITQVVAAAAYVYAAMSGFTFLVFLSVLTLIPEIPEKPPSQVEAERRHNGMNITKQSTWRQEIRKFGIEMKILITRRSAATLLVITSLSFATNIDLFLLMPPIGDTPTSQNLTNGTTLAEKLNARKAFTLIWFTIGTIVGGVVVGKALDKTKSYHPLATIMSPSLVITGITMLIAFVFSAAVVMDCFAFVFGTILLGLQTFSGEVLKQHVFPSVSVPTYGVAIAFLSNISQVLLAGLGRAIIDVSNSKYFFVYNLACSVLISTLTLSINPPLERFLSEKRALLTDCKHEVNDCLLVSKVPQ